MSMYTDPNHIHIEDPGQIEGNMVFTYLDIFDSDKQKVAELKRTLPSWWSWGCEDQALLKRSTRSPIRTDQKTPGRIRSGYP